MRKHDIETTLKELQAPAPSPEARLRAKRAALAEFTRVQAANQSEARAGLLQVVWRKLRLSRDDDSHGSFSMNWFASRGLYAGMAGIGVLAIGLTWVLPNVDRYSEDLVQARLPADAPQAALETVEAAPAAPGEVAGADAMGNVASSAGPSPVVAPETSVARKPAPMKDEARVAAAPAPASIEPQLAASVVADPQPLAPAPEPESVVVTGMRARLQAQEMKRSAQQPVDAIAAEDIAQMPDANLAKSLQRVAGVSTFGYDPETNAYRNDRDARDRFKEFEPNRAQRVVDAPVSTFSADVDTASYSFVRAEINDGRLPQRDAVRAEEMINYFEYAWPAADSRRHPFQPTVVVSDSPWSEGRKLVHIGIKGYEVRRGEAPDANLVLLLDVSGSMNKPDKLPLAVRSLELLLDSLKPTDTVGIVVYAGAAGTVLEPTPVREKARIVEALRSLRPGGSTAGAAGIERAYELAEANFRKGGVNRILLATDGDFNVGIQGTSELTGFVERKREKGVYLSVLGFGQGNYRDELAQALAQNGNGVAAYIDSDAEARKVLVQEAGAALFTIAKDVKLQVEFNPVTVSEYRLVGYETRALKREDFNNDAVDAGDVGAGHTVTAIYEITPVGVAGQSDEPRYPQNRREQTQQRRATNGSRDEFGFLKIRYKLPDEKQSKLLTEAIPLRTGKLAAAVARDVNFSTAVAGFAQLLRGGTYTGPLTYADVLREAEAAKGEDEHGYRAEFIELVRKAQKLH
jgi:Ca-activated chloride channel family protein